MRGCHLSSCLFLLFTLPAVALRAQPSAPPLQILDTLEHYRTALPADAWNRRSAWKALEEDDTSHAFQGDGVVVNERIALVFRKDGAGAELHSIGALPVLRAVLAPQLKNGRLTEFVVATNSADEIAIEATFASASGKSSVRFELQPGQPFVKANAVLGADSLRIEASCRYGLLPDFFAADIVLDARELSADRVELPSENFFLHMSGSGEAIVAAIWDQREKEMEIALSGSGDARAVQASSIPFGKSSSVYVGVLEAPGIWHEHSVARTDKGRVIPLGWHTPFPAHWRMDWRQKEGMNDSWDMLVERNDGEFDKPDWFGQADSFGNSDWNQGGRKRWTTVLGLFLYPCWIDRNGEACIQPLKKPGDFEGTVIAYPVNRTPATPLTVFTFVDLVRATLGVGPCQYVLDVEGQQKKSAGRPTCATRALLDEIYTAKQQLDRKAEVEQALDDVLAFMHHIRGRIEDYAEFSRRLQEYLREQKKARPELATFLDSLVTTSKRIDEAIAKRNESIGTREYAGQLVDEFRSSLVGYEGSDAQDRCKKITAGFVEIGGNQDELVGECRLAVRILRQQAALAMASDPRVTEIAQEVRRRTHAMLRNPTSYEAPRH
jgi:hypothetical protein